MKRHLKTGGKMRRKIIAPVLILTSIVFVLLFSGCSPEKELAKTFVKSHSIGPALVFTPAFIYKYNLKTDSLHLKGLTKQEKDSVLWFTSDFIQKIDDSVFLANYEGGYLHELQQYGIKTFTTDQTDQFFNADSNGFVVNIAQIELEEQYYPYEDQVDVDGMTYSHQQQLNALDVSSWFEVRLVNNPDKDKVLFAENLLTDDFEGFFEQNPFTGQIQYFFHNDSLTMRKIYHYAYNLGRTYASYTFDYLLNRYLDNHLPAEKRSNTYLRYDPYKKTFFPAGDNKFDTDTQ